jgi:hypothetical protein
MYDEKQMHSDRVSQPQREPQVSTAFNDLEMAIERNFKVGSELEQRLKMALRNEPEEAAKPEPGSRTLVPLADRIMESVRRLQSLEIQYSSILRRLEL